MYLTTSVGTVPGAQYAPPSQAVSRVLSDPSGRGSSAPSPNAIYLHRHHHGSPTWGAASSTGGGAEHFHHGSNVLDPHI